MRAAIRQLARLRVPLAAAAAGSCSLVTAGALCAAPPPAPAPSAALPRSYAYGAPPRAGAASPLSLPKPQVLFVLGGPGAGKGTQCARLVDEYGYVHLSAGDLLRLERDSGSPDGEMIENFIREGKIVPVEVTVALIRKAMQRAAPGGGGRFLIDGFPRNFNNLEGWHTVMGDSAEVNGVLMFDCPEPVMEARLLRRGETSGRSDDTADVIRKRFHTYVTSTLPVITHYEARGQLFRVLADKPVDAVFADTRRAVEPLLAAEVARYHQLLVDAVHAGDWDMYTRLSAPDMTAIEAESNGQLVAGLPFHKYFFDAAAARRKIDAAAASAAGRAAPAPSTSTVSPSSDVRLLGGRHALVTGGRAVARAAGTELMSESRVWEYVAGVWRQVHFHRSTASAAAPPTLPGVPPAGRST